MSISLQQKLSAILTATAIVAILSTTARSAIGEQAAVTGVLPGAGASLTLRYDASLRTPKRTSASGATIKLAALGNRTVRVEVHPDDGTPPRSVDLVVGSDGSLQNAASSSDAAAPSDSAKTLLADLKLAAHIAGAIKKSASNEAIDVPVTLEPVGQGSAVTTSAQLVASHPTTDVTTYSGTAEGRTTAVLPSGTGGANPQDAMASAGGSVAVAHHFGMPAGMAAGAAIRHHQRKHEQEAAGEPVPVAMALALKAQVHAGHISTIAGMQTNSLHAQGQAVDVVETWTFTSLR